MTCKLLIESLSDAQYRCSCGAWFYRRTGTATREDVIREWRHHVKWMRRKAKHLFKGYGR